MLKRKDIRPFQLVINRLSQNIGLTLPDPKNKRRLHIAHPFFVCVHAPTKKGKKRKTFWCINNISLYQSSVFMHEEASRFFLPKKKKRLKK